MPYDHVLNRSRVISFRLWRGSPRLVACSVCLRVRDRGSWIDATEAIRRLRTFEYEKVVRLGCALCERCEAELWLQRRRSRTELAA